MVVLKANDRAGLPHCARPSRARLMLFVCAGMTLSMSACKTAGPDSGTGNRPKGGQSPDAPFAGTPVDVSTLREDAIKLVETMSKSEDSTIRANAVEAASLVPNRLRSIVDAGLSDSSPGVRSVAASAVARAQLRDLTTHVTPLLNDKVNHVQASAILAMAKNGKEVDQSPLATLLMTDESAWTSRQAAYVLGELGNRSALGLLRSAANNRTSVLPPNQQRPFQLQVAEAMVKLGETDQLPVLRASLYPSQMEDLEGAALGVQILGELRDRESIGQLMNVVAYRDRTGSQYPAEIRLGAAGALARMGIENGAGTADQYLKDPSRVIRMQVASVYGNHPGPLYWDRLKTLMADPEPSVRLAAAAGVLRSGTR